MELRHRLLLLIYGIKELISVVKDALVAFVLIIKIITNGPCD